MYEAAKRLITTFPRLLTSIIQYGCITHCFLEYIADVAICSGPSMEPTLHSNDVIVSEHISTKLYRFHYGDIVISKSVTNPRELVCKRITALPGDRIQYKQIKVVPPGHVWLEGDNRDNSSDSKDYGPVPQGLIRGRVICKIWPVNDITMLTVKSQ